MIRNRSRLSLASVYTALLWHGFVGCGSDSASDSAASNAAGAPSGAGTSASGSAGGAGRDAGTGGSGGSGGAQSVDRDAGDSASDATIQGDSGPPPATASGESVYTLECRGDSRDCDGNSVPCFGLLGDAGPIGYACANRCESAADCSTVPSGAEAEVDCVQLTSARHCLLVCKFETQEFACPDGMGCYVYPGSPIGYCLWM